MKRTLFVALLAAAALPFLSGLASAQVESPIADAWKGQIATKDSGQEISLFIFDDEKGLNGLILLYSEDKKDYELMKIVFKDNKLTFEYGDPYETGFLPRTKVELKFEDDTLNGTWSDSQGRSGTMKLTRDKTGPAS
jgi:hypothetical protein